MSDGAPRGTRKVVGFVLSTPAFGLWCLISALLIGSHIPAYFHQPHYEHGDFAANALQITRAKHFQEIHGNYSRFGFHHPGPVFFYLYAAAESLLFDKLGVVPAPYNAHLIAGVLLQSLFFAWALGIVHKRTQMPLVVPLMLLFAALHFGTVNSLASNSAFQSIWPPHVLLFPFLLFLVAGASVAAGEIKDLVPMVLAGCFLVHGHVAQPLFVVPLFLLAYGSYYFRQRRGTVGFSLTTMWRSNCGLHSIAAGIIAIFLLPLLVDVARGTESNLYQIATHFTANAGDRKSLAQSMLYLAAFLCYVEPQNFSDTGSIVFLKDRWYFVAGWVLVAVATILVWRKGVPRRVRQADMLVQWLVIFFGAAVLLTLIWGMLQNGPMAGFNSYFNFALLFIPWILLAVGIAFTPTVGSAEFVRGTVLGVSMPLLIFASRNFSFGPDFPTLPDFGAELHAEIVQAVKEDPQSRRTKYLRFEAQVWPAAVGVALALKRLGYKYRTAPEWELIFGPGTGVPAEEAFARGNTALWWVRDTSLRPGWLTTGAAVIDPRGGEIAFSGREANANGFVSNGWDISDGPYSWSIGKSATLWFSPKSTTEDVRITFAVLPSSEEQRMKVSFNEGPSQIYLITNPTEVALDVPAAVWNARKAARLTFEFPDAMSPKDRGHSTDPRELGCGFVRITFETL